LKTTDKRAASEEEDQGFEWKGKRVLTIGDLGSAAAALETEEEGAAFMKAYLAVNVHAYANVGYVAAYYDSTTAQRIYRLCGTAHPVFGTTTPTPEAAFDAGQRMAKAQP
jgi:hypothetical protein